VLGLPLSALANDARRQNGMSSGPGRQMRGQRSGAIGTCSSLSGLVGLSGRASWAPGRDRRRRAGAVQRRRELVHGVALPADGGYTAQ